MKISPLALFVAAVASFGAIVTINVFIANRNNEEFKTKLSNIDPAEVFALRKRVVAEENMVPEPVIEDDSEDE